MKYYNGFDCQFEMPIYDFDKAIEKSLLYEKILEGTKYDYENKKVSLTDKDQKGINFSLEENPTHYRYKGLEIYSIFQRTNYSSNRKKDQSDGNPFIYALKNTLDGTEKYDGWKLDIASDDIGRWFKRYMKVQFKIYDEFDTLIVVPSKSSVNTRLSELVQKHFKFQYVLYDFFYKKKYKEIRLDYKQLEEDIKKKSHSELEFQYHYNRIKTKLEENLYETHDPNSDFEIKYFPKNYAKYLVSIFNYNSKRYKRYSEFSKYFNGKKLLILDDTISSGETLIHCAKAIKNMFSPKSIKIITLLSIKNLKSQNDVTIL